MIIEHLESSKELEEGMSDAVTSQDGPYFDTDEVISKFIQSVFAASQELTHHQDAELRPKSQVHAKWLVRTKGKSMQRSKAARSGQDREQAPSRDISRGSWSLSNAVKFPRAAGILTTTGMYFFFSCQAIHCI